MEGIIVDNAFVENNLLDKEFALLKTASKYSQFLDRTARDFRDILIARECITPNVAYSESIEKKELICAIKMCWLLGYIDEKTPANSSDGLFSDFEFLQASSKKRLEELVKDNRYSCKLLRLWIYSPIV